MLNPTVTLNFDLLTSKLKALILVHGDNDDNVKKRRKYSKIEKITISKNRCAKNKTTE